MTKKFNKTEEAVFMGHLLGDGHVQKRGKQAYRTRIQHCEKQLSYVEWKYKQLERFAYDKPKLVVSKQGASNYLFYLESGVYLKKYHDLFYKPYVWTSKNETNEKPKIRYRKTITETLINYLPKDPLLLAVWFMDDGNLRPDCFSGRLATQGFSKEEHFLLQDYIATNFSIKTSIVLHNAVKKSYYLSIPAKHNNFSNFVDLVRPAIAHVPCMQYKIKATRNDFRTI
jgi:hypothetical protein